MRIGYRNVAVALLLLVQFVAGAQVTIRGVVTDAVTGKPLSFANIGIRDKNTGCISTDSGAFELQLPATFAQDTLTLSMVGYEDSRIALAVAQEQHVFSLNPRSVNLQEYAVSAKKMRERKYGLYKYHPLLHFLDGSVVQNDIFEIAQKVDLGSGRVKVTSVNLHVNETTPDSGLFRINFYAYEGRKPGRRLVEQQVLQKKAIRDGWMRFDLSRYNIWLSGQVVAAIEFIPQKGGKRIPYEVKPGAGGFLRRASQGSWQLQPHRYRMYVTALSAGDNDDQETKEPEARPTFSLWSEQVQDSFCIFLSLPANYTTSTREHFPVIYVLDANIYFAPVRDSLQHMAGRNAILVGIGYKDFAYMDSFRARDYTSPRPIIPEGRGDIRGSGEQFYQFVRTRLVPYIDSAYRTDTAQRTLMGHSLGGYFTLFALYRDLQLGERLFSKYVAASPSIQYNNWYLPRKLEAMRSKAGGRQLLLNYGDQEEDDAQENDTYNKQMCELAGEMSVGGHIVVHLDVCKMCGHMETVLPLFYKGLQP